MWFNFGIEFAPGITFNHLYTSNYFTSVSEYLINPANNNAGYENYNYRFSNNELDYGTIKKLNGIGFVDHITVPLSAQVRISKKIKILRHLNLVSTIAPGLYITSNKYSGLATNFTTKLILGLRYNL